MHEDDDASSKASKVAPPLGDAPPPPEISLGKQEVPDPPHLEATPWA